MQGAGFSKGDIDAAAGGDEFSESSPGDIADSAAASEISRRRVGELTSTSAQSSAENSVNAESSRRVQQPQHFGRPAEPPSSSSRAALQQAKAADLASSSTNAGSAAAQTGSRYGRIPGVRVRPPPPGSHTAAQGPRDAAGSSSDTADQYAGEESMSRRAWPLLHHFVSLLTTGQLDEGRLHAPHIVVDDDAPAAGGDEEAAEDEDEENVAAPSSSAEDVEETPLHQSKRDLLEAIFGKGFNPSSSSARSASASSSARKRKLPPTQADIAASLSGAGKSISLDSGVRGPVRISSLRSVYDNDVSSKRIWEGIKAEIIPAEVSVGRSPCDADAVAAEAAAGSADGTGSAASDGAFKPSTTTSGVYGTTAAPATTGAAAAPAAVVGAGATGAAGVAASSKANIAAAAAAAAVPAVVAAPAPAENAESLRSAVSRLAEEDYRGFVPLLVQELAGEFGKGVVVAASTTSSTPSSSSLKFAAAAGALALASKGNALPSPSPAAAPATILDSHLLPPRPYLAHDGRLDIGGKPVVVVGAGAGFLPLRMAAGLAGSSNTVVSLVWGSGDSGDGSSDGVTIPPTGIASLLKSDVGASNMWTAEIGTLPGGGRLQAVIAYIRSKLRSDPLLIGGVVPQPGAGAGSSGTTGGGGSGSGANAASWSADTASGKVSDGVHAALLEQFRAQMRAAIAAQEGDDASSSPAASVEGDAWTNDSKVSIGALVIMDLAALAEPGPAQATQSSSSPSADAVDALLGGSGGSMLPFEFEHLLGRLLSLSRQTIVAGPLPSTRFFIYWPSLESLVTASVEAVGMVPTVRSIGGGATVTAVSGNSGRVGVSVTVQTKAEASYEQQLYARASKAASSKGIPGRAAPLPPAAPAAPSLAAVDTTSVAGFHLRFCADKRPRARTGAIHSSAAIDTSLPVDFLLSLGLIRADATLLASQMVSIDVPTGLIADAVPAQLVVRGSRLLLATDEVPPAAVVAGASSLSSGVGADAGGAGAAVSQADMLAASRIRRHAKKAAGAAAAAASAGSSSPSAASGAGDDREEEEVEAAASAPKAKSKRVASRTTSSKTRKAAVVADETAEADEGDAAPIRAAPAQKKAAVAAPATRPSGQGSNSKASAAKQAAVAAGGTTATQQQKKQSPPVQVLQPVVEPDVEGIQVAAASTAAGDEEEEDEEAVSTVPSALKAKPPAPPSAKKQQAVGEASAAAGTRSAGSGARSAPGAVKPVPNSAEMAPVEGDAPPADEEEAAEPAPAPSAAEEDEEDVAESSLIESAGAAAPIVESAPATASKTASATDEGDQLEAAAAAAGEDAEEEAAQPLESAYDGLIESGSSSSSASTSAVGNEEDAEEEPQQEEVAPLQKPEPVAAKTGSMFRRGRALLETTTTSSSAAAMSASRGGGSMFSRANGKSTASTGKSGTPAAPGSSAGSTVADEEEADDAEPLLPKLVDKSWNNIRPLRAPHDPAASAASNGRSAAWAANVGEEQANLVLAEAGVFRSWWRALKSELDPRSTQASASAAAAWSMLVHGHGTALLSAKLARAYPRSTIVSVKTSGPAAAPSSTVKAGSAVSSDPAGIAAHADLLRLLGVTNNFVASSSHGSYGGADGIVAPGSISMATAKGIASTGDPFRYALYTSDVWSQLAADTLPAVLEQQQQEGGAADAASVSSSIAAKWEERLGSLIRLSGTSIIELLPFPRLVAPLQALTPVCERPCALLGSAYVPVDGVGSAAGFSSGRSSTRGEGRTGDVDGDGFVEDVPSYAAVEDESAGDVTGESSQASSAAEDEGAASALDALLSADEDGLIAPPASTTEAPETAELTRASSGSGSMFARSGTASSAVRGRLLQETSAGRRLRGASLSSSLRGQAGGAAKAFKSIFSSVDDADADVDVTEVKRRQSSAPAPKLVARVPSVNALASAASASLLTRYAPSSDSGAIGGADSAFTRLYEPYRQLAHAAARRAGLPDAAVRFIIDRGGKDADNGVGTQPRILMRIDGWTWARKGASSAVASQANKPGISLHTALALGVLPAVRARLFRTFLSLPLPSIARAAASQPGAVASLSPADVRLVRAGTEGHDAASADDGQSLRALPSECAYHMLYTLRSSGGSPSHTFSSSLCITQPYASSSDPASSATKEEVNEGTSDAVLVQASTGMADDTSIREAWAALASQLTPLDTATGGARGKFSFVEYGSDLGHVSLALARSFPEATVLSIEGDEESTNAHLAASLRGGILNNIIARGAVDAELFRRLHDSPEFFRYQALSQDLTSMLLKAGMKGSTGISSLQSAIGTMLAVAATSFLRMPPAALLSLAFTTFTDSSLGPVNSNDFWAAPASATAAGAYTGRLAASATSSRSTADAAPCSVAGLASAFPPAVDGGAAAATSCLPLGTAHQSIAAIAADVDSDAATMRASLSSRFSLASHPRPGFASAEMRLLSALVRAPAGTSIRIVAAPLPAPSHLPASMEDIHPPDAPIASLAPSAMIGGTSGAAWSTSVLSISSGLVRVDIANLTRHVNHHFQSDIDGHSRKYTLRVQANYSAGADIAGYMRDTGLDGVRDLTTAPGNSASSTGSGVDAIYSLLPAGNHPNHGHTIAFRGFDCEAMGEAAADARAAAAARAASGKKASRADDDGAVVFTPAPSDCDPDASSTASKLHPLIPASAQRVSLHRGSVYPGVTSIILTRDMDGALIPYDSVHGITLISGLRLGLLSPLKQRAYHQFVSLPLYQDMAPWNIVFLGE